MTLIETLVALSILAIAGVAIMAGLQLAVKSSDIHRKQSTGGSAVRTYAEAIEKYLDADGNYVPCAGAGAYAPATVGYAVPSGYTASASAAQPLDGNGSVITTGSCPSRDKGVQRLTLTVASSDSRATERLTIVVRRSCGTGTACP
ncbi:type II secretory pathway pseudopilin PulG [Nocardioides aromaticivorans]|uniref:Type II secretory pathway pseudopilin PulG n=1 Tax=Nocardioides aromaticivorans TaxID=200618 RepID=A0A7Z0CQB5_9ACTN|nr:type II secretion system protein [Nocardioides aromaticivorans]NYI46637.1 type II secretory pathway pseudopilin PulG [Nocardioides aromaticivorans]